MNSLLNFGKENIVALSLIAIGGTVVTRLIYLLLTN